MVCLSISLIGSLRIYLDGQEARGFPSNKVRALLAYLAVESGRPHARRTLASLLWPDYPDPSALTYLRNALVSLRQVLEDAEVSPHFLLVTRETLQLNPAADISIDLHTFDDLLRVEETSSDRTSRLQSAVALYRGSFLEGFSCDSTAFEEWALVWRERLGRQLREVLARLASAYASAGEYGESIQTARQLLELEPWDEQAHRLVMQGLVRSGQRNAALAQYDACRRVLHTELGVAPDAETQDLFQQISAGALSLTRKSDAMPSSPAAHLPNSLTSFIGRQHELDDICHLLKTARLLTLTGAGGCGKTRLAIAAARKMTDEGLFTNGAWWVDLSPISDPALVLSTLAISLGLAESSQIPLQQMLESYLRPRMLLLVLDNIEHLIDAIAGLAERLLMACPGLRILATSREPLGVPGEVIWRVPSLSVPEHKENRPVNPAEIEQFDAVRLFVERAQVASPDWSLNDSSADVIAICTRLDGIPLAIELAAARVRLLTVEQIAVRLHDAFHLLTGGSRTALPRHQTLRACIDWSYELLTPAERALLRRLSIFAGGWTLEAAETVGRLESDQTVEDILNLLARLVDRSLVMVSKANNQEMRYRLLDTIRQYAHEKLIEAGEEETVRNEHIDYFLALCSEAEPHLRTLQAKYWLDQLDQEIDNLRLALEGSLSCAVEKGLQMATALFWFWWTRNRIFEGIGWLDRLIQEQENHFNLQTIDQASRVARGRALNMLFLKFSEGNRYLPYRLIQQAKARRIESQTIFQALGDLYLRDYAISRFNQTTTLDDLLECRRLFQAAGDLFWVEQCDMSITFCYPPDSDWATFYGEENLAISREIGDQDGAAGALMRLSFFEASRGRMDRAIELGSESIDGFNAIGNRFFAGKLRGVMSWFYLTMGNHQEALKQCEQMLDIAQEINDQILLQNYQFRRGWIAWAQKHYEQAINYAEKAMALAKELPAEFGVVPLYILSYATLLQGNVTQTRAYMSKLFKIEAFWEYNAHEFNFRVLQALGVLATLEGQMKRAVYLFSAEGNLFHPHKCIGCYQFAQEREAYDQALATARTAMGEEAFHVAWEAGRAMTVEQVIQLAQALTA